MLVGALVGIPGASYLTALHNLVTGKSSTATQVVAVVIFVIIDFLLIIIPFAFLELRPEATKALLKHSQDWLLSHALQLMATIALLLGAYLAISGLIRLQLTASRAARQRTVRPACHAQRRHDRKAAQPGRNHPQKGMTYPDGSNRIGHKPPGSPGEGSGVPGMHRDSGIGGQHDIGNNNHAQRKGRAPRGRPRRTGWSCSRPSSCSWSASST